MMLIVDRKAAVQLFSLALITTLGVRGHTFNLTLTATNHVRGKLYPNNMYRTMADGWMVDANGTASESSWSEVFGGPAKVFM